MRSYEAVLSRTVRNNLIDVEQDKLQIGGYIMSMRALDLGLAKASLLAEPKGSELLYHLRQAKNKQAVQLANIEMKQIRDTDFCHVYKGNQLIAITSTQELSKLIRIASLKTMEMVRVSTDYGDEYYAAVHQQLTKNTYVGALTDEKSRVVAFVMEVNGTYWAQTGYRLFQLDYKTNEVGRSMKPQDCIRYINKHKNRFKNVPDEIILFQ